MKWPWSLWTSRSKPIYEGLAILIPSLNRPGRLKNVVQNIHSATTVPHKIYWCISDAKSAEILTDLGEWFLDDSADKDHRYVTRMNKLVRCIENEETIFFGSDDVVHHAGWYEAARAVMDTGHQLVVVNDLHNASGTQALMHRDYLQKAVFDSPGDVFYKGYGHNFADNEQHFTAHLNGQYARSYDSIVEHLHPLFAAPNSLDWDETYKRASKTWTEDEALWKVRFQLIQNALERPQEAR